MKVAKATKTKIPIGVVVAYTNQLSVIKDLKLKSDSLVDKSKRTTNPNVTVAIKITNKNIDNG